VRLDDTITAGSILLWTCTVVAAAAGEALWFAQPAVVRGDVRSVETHLVQALEGAAADGRVGSAALVLVHGGRVAARHGFGVSADTRSPVETNRTLYQMASVSKAVTAWGVMKLVEQGVLNLDAPVTRYLERWRFAGSDQQREKVTVRHLLSHTAGLDEGAGLRGFAPGERIQTLEETLSGVTVATTPGTSLSYGNANYAVLQLLIEDVTKQSFATYMNGAVLRPLGMTTAIFSDDALVSEGRDRDLAPNFDAGLTLRPRRRYPASAAVALYATAEDMAHFVRAFTGANPVLAPETLRSMLAPQPGTSGAWGLGLTLFVENGTGGHVVGHDGGAYPAWGAMVRVNPATGNGLVLLVSGSRGAVNQLGHDWVYWETGQITAAARRQIVYRRLVPATAAVVAGGALLGVWGWLRRRRSRRGTSSSRAVV
jgi:CubicO group peptidase (beta-lactamase class C family)